MERHSRITVGWEDQWAIAQQAMNLLGRRRGVRPCDPEVG
jgi:hypothetical protein